jgi:hypothetical protein
MLCPPGDVKLRPRWISKPLRPGRHGEQRRTVQLVVVVIASASVPSAEERLGGLLETGVRDEPARRHSAAGAGTAPGGSTAAWAASPCPCTAFERVLAAVGTLQAVLNLLGTVCSVSLRT